MIQENAVGNLVDPEEFTRTPIEDRIEKILNEIGASYVRGYSFDEKGLRSKKYDFAVKRKDGTIGLLIEYDGTEHYSEERWYADMGARIERAPCKVIGQMLKDAKYTKTAAERGIPVLRITKVYQPKLRHLLLSWIWMTVDKPDEEDNAEINLIKMLDHYGWDFEYTRPNGAGKRENEFIDAWELEQLLS